MNVCLWLVVVVVVGMEGVAVASVRTPCTAAAVFLRTTAPSPENDSRNQLHSNPLSDSTYTIPVVYPCDSSPLPRIDKLRKAVHDPFISFYLKKAKKKRDIYSLDGSGAGGGEEEYDDDDDDDDDDDEEEEDEIDQLDRLDGSPSLHVIPVLPTPTFDYQPNSAPPPLPASEDVKLNLIEPTPTVVNYAPTTSSTTTTTDDELVFALGSGDGPLVMVTPVYQPAETPPSTTTYYSSSSVSSSSAATPTLSSYLLHPIPKQLIYSGSPHSFTIPENTFQPACSSYELNSSEPWADITASTLSFFPTTSHISDYVLKVVCQPFQSIAEVYVSVRQRQKSRLHNHAFQLEFGMIRENMSRVQLMNRIVAEISAAVDSSSNTTSGNLVVLSTELDSYPFRLTYVNETVLSNVCPVDELRGIYQRLQGLSGGVVHLERVVFTVPPDNNQCDASKVVGEVTGESGIGGSHSTTTNENYPPTIKNQIDRLNGTVGEYLVYHVREDFCYDPEDGGTRNLKLELRSNEMGEVSPDYWLQFDAKNQEFYGLPMSVEERDLILVCADRGGKQANDVLELQIHPPRTPPTSYNTEFNLHFKSIPFNPKAIRKFIEKLGLILSPHIQVNSYTYSNNHVLFKWFNTTNPSTEQQVSEIRGVMLSDDGPVSKRLYEHFTPEFNVTVASVIPLRKLLSENSPVDDDDHDGRGGAGGGSGKQRYFDFDEVDQREDSVGNADGSGNLFGDGVGVVQSAYLTTYIVPSVLIAAMILLALIIACLLSRKNKYTRASSEDHDSPNNRVYLKNAKKGVPVIFQEELEEKQQGQAQQQQQQRSTGNIYEPPLSGGGTPTARYQQQQQTTPNNRVVSPQPLHHGGGRMSASSTPQPPDYQNSISRSMMRGSRGGSNPPPGGVGVYPGTHNTGASSSPRYNNIDAYAPPPGINYYGIHTSNSGGSGFSGRSDHHHHHHHGGVSSNSISSSNQNKMAPPPYVPP